MTVANHIADLQDIVDYAKTLKAAWDATYAGILSSQVGAPDADTYGELERLAKSYGLGSPRADFAEMLGKTRNMARAWARSLAQDLDRGDINPNNPVQVMLGLREWMLINSKVFESRGVTNGAGSSGKFPSGSITGDGTYDLFEDDDQSTADKLEAANASSITFRCVRSQGEGVDEGSEQWQYWEDATARDILEQGGGGARGFFNTASGSNNRHLANADFEDEWGATDADTGKIPSWTIDSNPTNVAEETTTVFRGSKSVQLEGATSLYQAYSGLPQFTPILFSLRYNRSVSSGTGTLKLIAGSQTATTGALSGASSGWQRLSQILWPRRFSGGNHRVQITLDTTDEAISGDTYIDEIVVRPMKRIGGRFHMMSAGATPFALDDQYTQATTIAATGLMKDWLHLWFGLEFELPHGATASTGWEDPT